MSTIEYRTLERGSLEVIRPLWEKLRLHHHSRSRYFASYYETFTFEKRTEKFLKNDIDLHIETAAEKDSGDIIAYCISTVNAHGEGEVDSIYVEAAFRGAKIGDTLMKHALAWMDVRKASARTVTVSAGNEDAFPFYMKYGFYPAYSLLRQKK